MFKKIKHILKNTRFGMYPACDHLNCALHFLLKNPDNKAIAIEEILYAIFKANGYLNEHLKPELKEMGFDGLVRSIEEHKNH